MLRLLFLSCLAVITSLQASAEGQLLKLQVRASKIESPTKEHPEIDFVFTNNGKSQDGAP